MPFYIDFTWRERATDAVARNEELAQILLAEFPSLTRFPLDFELIAKEIKVPRDQIFSHWCQVELDSNDGELGRVIITLWLESVVVQVPLRPVPRILATLERLAPLFAALRAIGLETDPEFDVLTDYEKQKDRVEQVACIVGEGG